MATIRKGSTGPDVSRWQDLLNNAGFVAPRSGVFDDPTDTATRAWQAVKGLTVDGIVGRASWDAMLGTLELRGPSGPPPYTIASIKGLADKTSNLFRWRLLGIAERLGANADHIAAVMATESAGTFSPSVKNPNGGATGLIQFIPATAHRLGTTTDALAAMTAEDQLRYVERYMRPFEGRLKSPTDVYMTIFLPAFVGRSPSFVVGRSGDNSEAVPGITYNQIYESNRGFDRNNDGEILIGEVGYVVDGLIKSAQSRPRIDVIPEEDPPLTTGDIGTVGSVGAARSLAPNIMITLLGIGAAGAIVWLRPQLLPVTIRRLIRMVSK